VPAPATNDLATFAGRAMASPLRLTLPASASAERVWAAVVDEFELAESAMSRFRDTSEVTRLNRRAGSGESVVVSRRLRLALAVSDRAHRVTGGRFDPRVLRALDALGDVGAFVPSVSWGAPGCLRRVVELDRRRGVLVEEPLDLGGIGKGLALRWATARIRELGVDTFLLDAGGDIVAAGRPPRRAPDGPPAWQVGIEDPAGAPIPVAVVSLVAQAIATSSVRVRSWIHEGRRVHHLIDPRSGAPADTSLLAVTVAGPDAAWSEIWSKALFIGGERNLGARARAEGLAAWWVLDDGRLEMTPAARQLTAWVRSERPPVG
jgi:thiamine biosynthesis lipoprotein